MNLTAERLRKLREGKNLSQAYVAEVIGISRPAYVRYETGVSRPVRKLKELSELFGVSTDYLLGNDESPISVDEIQLTSKDEKHIAKLLESILDDVESGNTFAAHGGTIEDEVEKELFKKSLHEALSYAKKKAKLKFTPKKFQR